MSYYITSIGYNVLYEELEETLCELEERKAWKQPHIDRYWAVSDFDSEYSALLCLREIYPDRLLTVLEDTGKVVSTHGHESGFTSMVIRKVGNPI